MTIFFGTFLGLVLIRGPRSGHSFARAAPATALRDAFRAATQEKEKHKENAPVDAETHHPRVVVIPELERAMAEAVDAVRDRGGGVVCVLGSLNVVARAETWANGTGGE